MNKKTSNLQGCAHTINEDRGNVQEQIALAQYIDMYNNKNRKITSKMTENIHKIYTINGTGLITLQSTCNNRTTYRDRRGVDNKRQYSKSNIPLGKH
jgi:hypothetical protein